jgi:hypothetical protein
MFANARRDLAAAMAVLLLGMVRAFDEYPQPDARTVALAGIGLGLAFGSRILAGIAAPYALAALLMIVIGEARTVGFRPMAARVGEFIFWLLPALALGYLIGAAVAGRSRPLKSAARRGILRHVSKSHGGSSMPAS